MALHDGMMVLRQAQSETGLHPGDLLVEIRDCPTLSSGTAECPTSFEDGQILAAWAFRTNYETAGAGVEALAVDLTVVTGAVTVVSSNASSAIADVKVVLIGRPKVG